MSLEYKKYFTAADRWSNNINKDLFHFSFSLLLPGVLRWQDTYQDLGPRQLQDQGQEQDITNRISKPRVDCQDYINGEKTQPNFDYLLHLYPLDLT